MLTKRQSSVAVRAVTTEAARSMVPFPVPVKAYDISGAFVIVTMLAR